MVSPRRCQMRIKFNWSVDSLAVSESICGMSNFKTEEITEISKIFHLKLLTEKIFEFLNAIKVITSYDHIIHI